MEQQQTGQFDVSRTTKRDLVKMLGYGKRSKNKLSKDRFWLFEILINKEEELKKRFKIASTEEDRRRFAAVAQYKRHEANASIEAATSQVLAVREMMHCKEGAANIVAEAGVTYKKTILTENFF